MKRKKKIMGVTLLVAILICSSLYILHNNDVGKYKKQSNLRVSELRKSNTNTEKVTMMYASEAKLTDEQLIDMSELVVRGTITKKLGDYDYNTEPDESGVSSKIGRSLYALQLKEVIKGNDVKEITISGPTYLISNAFELGKDYILCLVHLDGDYENAYSLVSVSQGILSVNDSNLKNNANQNKDIDTFKKSVNDVKEKNKKGIKIENCFKNDNNR